MPSCGANTMWLSPAAASRWTSPPRPASCAGSTCPRDPARTAAGSWGCTAPRYGRRTRRPTRRGPARPPTARSRRWTAGRRTTSSSGRSAPTRAGTTTRGDRPTGRWDECGHYVADDRPGRVEIVDDDVGPVVVLYGGSALPVGGVQRDVDPAQVRLVRTGRPAGDHRDHRRADPWVRRRVGPGGGDLRRHAAAGQSAGEQGPGELFGEAGLAGVPPANG